jgi:hypothetical protein
LATTNRRTKQAEEVEVEEDGMEEEERGELVVGLEFVLTS